MTRWRIDLLTRKLVLLGVALAIVLVLINLLAGLFFNNTRSVENLTEQMARDYYENYFYPKFTLGAVDLEARFKEYKDTGFEPVLLRHLLLNDGGKYEKWRKEFTEGKVVCDTNISNVKYYPEAPFGRKNYRIEQRLSCEK